MKPRRIVYVISRRLRRFFLRLFYRGIWLKIAWRFMLAVNIPVLILCFLLINNSSRAVKNSVFRNHTEIVSRVACEVGDFIHTPDIILRSIASYLVVSRPDPWGQESVLVNQVLNYPFFLRITAFDSAGTVVASSDMGIESAGLDGASRDSLLQNSAYVSGIRDISKHSPYITIAAPIRERGSVTGFLSGDINLRSLWKIMDGIALEKTGTVFIVAGDGTLIAARDKKKILSGADLTASADVRQALAGRTGSMELAADGKQWISSFASVRGLGWGVVLRQERSEALSFSDKMREHSLVFLLLMELGMIVISVGLGRRLASYLDKVTDRLKGAAAGNFEGKLPRHRHDEIGELYKSINEMIAKRKKIDELERYSIIGEAASSIAHEFKNSMIALKSFVQLFPKKHNDAAFIETFGALVPREMQRWERMLKELSEFSSIDCMEKREMRAGEVIDEVLLMLSSECEGKGIAVVFLKKEELPLVADRERIKQVIMNIVLNAMQALPRGGRIEIVEEVLKKEPSFSVKYLSVRISDTGKGIPAAAIKNIFQPFHSSKSGSLGLGLAICRRIVANHNGSIRVESQPNVGTTFTILLPLP